MMNSKNDIQKVLILMPDCHIGNLVVSLPAIVALRDYYQSISYYLLIDSVFKEIVETIIDPAYTIFYPRREVRRGNVFKRSWAYLNCLRKIYGLRPDMTVDLEGGSTSGLLTKISGAKIRISRANADRKSVYTDFVPKSSGKHKVYDYTEIAAATGAVIDGRMFRFFPEKNRKIKVDGLLQEAGIDFSQPLVAIHAGAGRLQKLWNISGFVDVVDWLTGQGCQVVFVGGPDEVDRTEMIRAQLVRPASSFVGKLSLGELFPLLERSTVFLGNDSGPMHMAAAMGTSVVAMFSYADEHEWGPRSEQFIALRGQAVCKPCIKKKCLDPQCITSLSSAKVKEALATFLE